MRCSFDPEIAFNVREAANFEELQYKIGTQGEYNGSRTGDNRRTSRSSEAYCIRRWLLGMGRAGRLSYPLSIKHSDAPDFYISEGKLSYGMEVTEATSTEDGRERAKMEQADGSAHLLGSLGGRGRDGFLGDSPLQIVADDIQSAISRKSGKYLRETIVDLLIYPNSNPSLVFSFERERPRLLQMNFDEMGFRRVFVLWSDDVVSQIGLR